MKKTRFTRLKLGASALALTLMGGLAVSVPAMAQDAPAAPAADDGGVVVVTGLRGQLKSAQKLKKDSDVVQDSITAVDIGALPDRSVSEALQRISGLTIQRTNENRDPGRIAAEGGAVQIRGLSWVRSETNGRDIFSAKNGRGLSWEDVSADLLAGVDVYKNPSADLIEGGIGGTVNLRTRLPFDSKKRIVAFSVDTNYGDLQKKSHTSYNGIYSNQFDTSAGRLGVLFNYSVSDVGNRTDALNADKFETTQVGNATRYIPGGLSAKEIQWEQKRTAAYGALQWQPNTDWLFTLTAMDAKVDANNIEYGIFSWDWIGQANAPGNNFKYDSDGVFTGGTIPGALYDTDTRYGEDHKRTTDVAFNAKWWASDRLSFNFDVQHVKSTAEILSMTAYTHHKDNLPFIIDLSTDIPTIKVTGDTSKASDYYWAAAMDHIEDNEGEETAVRLDGRYDFDDSEWLKTFKFGVRTTDKDYITRQSGWNWSLLSYQYWQGSGSESSRVFLDDATRGPGMNGVVYHQYDNFFGGDAQIPGAAWMTAPWVVTNGTDRAYSLLRSTETQGWGWSPLQPNWDTYNPGGDNISGGVNHQLEKTAAAYGVVYFEHELENGRKLDGNIGVRAVKTEATGFGFAFAPQVNNAPPCVVGGNVTAATCQLAADAAAFGATAMKQPIEGKSDYTDILPSLNLRFKYNDELQFRFAVSKAIVRPELYQTNAYTTLGVGLTAGTNSYLVNLSGTAGNPSLEPIKATQYDATAEWYFAPTGSLVLNLFAKNIEDYIYGGNEVINFTNNGKTLPFNVTRYINGSEGKVNGFEIAYQQFYDFLPGAWSGFGVQANFTKIDSSGGHNPLVNIFDGNQLVQANLSGLPLEGMSPTSYNFAVMYEKYGISARLAYNWRDMYLLTTSGANINRPVWSEEYGQWDGSIFYTVNDHYKIGLQATNIGQAKTYLRVSNLDNLNVRPRYSWVATDRRVALVLRASF
ncbi:hypothetical protein ABAC460_14265 [Asticcacaulis sp. AC460]|uniref:TonB-dependent receptor n=1 Tax=Asticcacaulis sp. AC460 TaxID=1282360 RepID=UPI0003C3ACAA|nr:TonB-dependent receptor [Asticcacaulis sp. AC460]ESQ88942.1 hypothetical protein ABAC460_14265 [Asticcacaulis sp. AC460]